MKPVGDVKRTKIIVPVSAHGTNPASAALNGFSIAEVSTNSRGPGGCGYALKALLG
jgi:glycine cleavage system protein P-like pyridoxal-binding family